MKTREVPKVGGGTVTEWIPQNKGDVAKLNEMIAAGTLGGGDNAPAIDLVEPKVREGAKARADAKARARFKR
jgi:hypothetical protein